MMGKSDPYAVLRVVDRSDNVVKPIAMSRAVGNELNPKWNEQFDFEGLDSPSSYTLKVAVLDLDDELVGKQGEVADLLSPNAPSCDKILGEARVDLGTLKRSDDFQHMQLTIASGWFSSSTVSVGLHNWNEWGK
jgi:Ca2+-dependent lipid-binding protein